MRYALTSTAAALLLLGAGCAGIHTMPHPVHAVDRTFVTDADRVFAAVLEALEGTPLAAVDRASGTVVTDWVQGSSDTRYFGWPGRPQAWLQTRSKMTVRVRPTPPGIRVSVDRYEETNVPESVPMRTTSLRSPFVGSLSVHPAGPPPGWPWEPVQTVERDRWIPTPSSTRREKILLDRVEAILRRAHAAGLRGASHR